MAFTEPLRAQTLSICYAELRARGDVSLAERLALLREHRARPHERIRALRASGRALDGKIRIYEEQLGDHS